MSYIAADNISAADRVLDAIEARWENLARHPCSGVARDDIAPGIRHLVSGEYLTLYRLSGGAIEIVGVLHGRRKNPPKSLYNRSHVANLCTQPLLDKNCVPNYWNFGRHLLTKLSIKKRLPAQARTCLHPQSSARYVVACCRSYSPILRATMAGLAMAPRYGVLGTTSFRQSQGSVCRVAIVVTLRRQQGTRGITSPTTKASHSACGYSVGRMAGVPCCDTLE
jgi:toxin ParE1/3/4